jgi:hypothetical protein
MTARDATGGFVVTSGRFTDEATAFAEGRNVCAAYPSGVDRLIHRTASWLFLMGKLVV